MLIIVGLLDKMDRQFLIGLLLMAEDLLEVGELELQHYQVIMLHYIVMEPLMEMGGQLHQEGLLIFHKYMDKLLIIALLLEVVPLLLEAVVVGAEAQT